MIPAKPYQNYEEAVCDYLAKLRSLVQCPQGPLANTGLGALDFASGRLLQEAAGIAEASASITPLAQVRLNSPNPAIRESMRLQFLDQAIVELVLAIELLQCAEEQQNGLASPASSRATRYAMLREAVCALDRASSAPAAREFPAGGSRRVAEPATVAEAEAAYGLAVDGIVNGIRHRIEELGRDIAFDLMAEPRKTALFRSATLSGDEFTELLEAIHASTLNPHLGAVAVTMLSSAHAKIASLLDADIEIGARGRIGEWLTRIQQANKIELFDAPFGNCYQIEMLKASVKAGGELFDRAPESLYKSSDLTKALADAFTILVGRMRKLEDAMRLGKQVRIPQFGDITAAMRATLLAALVCSGHNCIHKDLPAILYKTGILVR